MPVGASPEWPSLPYPNGTHLLEAEALSSSGAVLGRAAVAVAVSNDETYTRGAVNHPVHVQHQGAAVYGIGGVLSGTLAGAYVLVSRYLTQSEIDVHNAQWSLASMRAMSTVDVAIDGFRFGTAKLATTGADGTGTGGIGTEGVATSRFDLPIDTARLRNGKHRLDWAGYGRSFTVTTDPVSMAEGTVLQGHFTFTTDNGDAPCELRGEWRDVYLTTGVRKLRWKLVRCNGSEEWLDTLADVTVENTNPEVATWDTDTVTPVADGVTYVRASYDPGGGRDPLVAGIRVVVAAAGHPVRHFTIEDGQPIRDTYADDKSIVRSSVQFLGPIQIYNYAETELQKYLPISGITTFEGGVYSYGTGSRTSHNNARDTADANIRAVLDETGMRHLGQMDDALWTAPTDDTKFVRAACAIEDWDGSDNGAAAPGTYRACDVYANGPDTDPLSRIEYAAAKLEARDANGDRYCVGIEVIDEATRQWGGDPLAPSGSSPSYGPQPDTITAFRAAVAGQTDVPMAWPPLAISNAEARHNWEQPSISDYVSHNLEILRNSTNPDLRRGLTYTTGSQYSWDPFRLETDYRWKWERIACMQAGLEGAGTKRQVPFVCLVELTAQEQIFQDPLPALQLAEWDLSSVSHVIGARIWQVFGEGAAGVRMYLFDHHTQRATRATNANGGASGQNTCAPPFASDVIGTRRWWSMGTALSVVETVKDLLLTELRDPPDLGGDVDVFARPHLLGFVNWYCVSITRTVDLSGIRGTGGEIVRYEIDDGRVAVTNLGAAQSDTVVVGVCGVVLWAWRAATAGPSLRVDTPNGLHTLTGVVTVAATTNDPTATLALYIDGATNPQGTRVGSGEFEPVDLASVAPAAGQSHLARVTATDALGNTTEARIVVNDRGVTGGGSPTITLALEELIPDPGVENVLLVDGVSQPVDAQNFGASVNNALAALDPAAWHHVILRGEYSSNVAIDVSAFTAIEIDAFGLRLLWSGAGSPLVVSAGTTVRGGRYRQAGELVDRALLSGWVIGGTP